MKLVSSILFSILSGALAFAESDEFEISQDVVEVREKIEFEPAPIDVESDELVELKMGADYFAPYKKRQTPWGLVVSAGAEIVNYPKLISQFDENSFENLFGSSGLTMGSIEFGPKYNFDWGSLVLLLGYGELSGRDDRIQVEATVNVKRYSGTLLLNLDAIMESAAIIPYAGAGLWQADYAETTEDQPDVTARYSTEIGYHVRAGALLGLDWLEPEAGREALRENGVKGAFLNLFVSSSYMNESTPDPNLETEFDLGASLTLEF